MTHQQAVDALAPERYLLDEMSEVERYQFEAHYFECAECAEDVRVGAMIREEARQGHAKPSTASTAQAGARILRPIWRRPMVAMPWAAAAALAVVASYQSFVAVPALRNVIAPQALEPVILRGATRGADPVVSIAPGQSFVTLAGDVVTDPQTRELAYELLDSGGSAVLSGRAPVPSTGVPLMLLVPAERLAEPGRYTLLVRDADEADAVIGEYAFVVG